MSSKFDLLKAEMKKRGMNVPDSVIREAIRRKDAGKGAEAPKKKKKKVTKSADQSHMDKDKKEKKPRKKVVKKVEKKKLESITPTQLKNLRKYYGKINPNREFSKGLGAGNILRKKVLAKQTEYSQGDHATLMADHKRILLEIMFQESKKKQKKPRKKIVKSKK